ncbi:pilus assembly PilX N-terminal domain-containing protein [Serpentinicella sp. ANB-PHB4]|uniref:type IV pilus modification PilV family protein n=1 Tax=Serpentinicella sp. ANB-PHB4 TaxID=3074076 RepID=UPI00285F93A2|nr:pilus assembly PilX N-terminal domain-containing protein [Serpentinicella sp. ANB-PHB4]MDR5658698.1 pilus assembly PilX N-terminal domain-containing protein [Serpentinicella sp. ANB-PHB4]
MNSYLRNENGVTLPLILVIFVILSILSMAIINISTAEHREVVYQENQMKAYYIARSGAEAIAAKIINEPEVLEHILGKTSNPSTISNGELLVEVEEINLKDEQKIKIIAKGTVPTSKGLVSDEVTIILKSMCSYSELKLFEHALYVKNKLALSNHSEILGGDIAISSQYDSVEIRNHAKIEKEIIYNVNTDLNKLPEYFSSDFFEFGISPDVEINTFHAGDFNLAGSNTINFNTGEKGNVLRVWVDGIFNISGNAKMNIQGEGVLELHATEVNIGNWTYGPEQATTIFYIRGDGKSRLSNHNEIKNTYIYAPNGKVEVFNHTNMSGSIYADEIEVNGTVTFIQLTGEQYSLLGETEILKYEIEKYE